MLDELRIVHGRLDSPVPIGEQGGSLHVELNHSDLSGLPAGFRVDSNDSRILAVALNLSADASHPRNVTLVSKDMPLRVKAAAVGLNADEYRLHPVADSTGWTGMAEIDVSAETVDALWDGDPIEIAGHADFDRVADEPCHTGLVLHSPKGSALARVTPDKSVRLVRGDREVFGLRGRSAEQRIALDLLLDPRSASSRSAGAPARASRRWRSAPASSPSSNVAPTSGSSCSARSTPSAARTSATCRAVRTRRWRPGRRPSSTPSARWSPAPRSSRRCMARGMLEVLPLTHIRGRSLHDSFVIVDEAQSLERGVLLTVLSRLGAPARGSCSPTTSRNATTCASVATTASLR